MGLTRQGRHVDKGARRGREEVVNPKNGGYGRIDCEPSAKGGIWWGYASHGLGMRWERFFLQRSR